MNNLVAAIDRHYCNLWLNRFFSAFRIGVQSVKFDFLTTIK